MILKCKISLLFFIISNFFLDAQTISNILFSGTFDGTILVGNTYMFPSDAQTWAGFANEDLSIYPLSFSDVGEISFIGSTSGPDVSIYFKFEYYPYPNTEPSFNTSSVIVSGLEEATYSLVIPDQGANIYNSFLLYVNTPDVAVTLTDVSLTSSEITDPCELVLCPEGEVCENGNCIDYNGPSIIAPLPEREPEDVISFYSDAYEDIVIDNFDFGLCPDSGTDEEMIADNAVQHYFGPGCQGILFNNNRVDASEFNNIHFDFYTNDTDLTGKVFNLKLVDWAGNLTQDGSTGLEINFNDGTNPNILSGSWISVDVDISIIGQMVSGNLTRNDIAELHITSNLENAWYDNVYLYKEIFVPGTCSDGILNQDETDVDCGGVCEACIIGPPIISAPVPPNRVEENVISIYSDVYENIIVDNFDFGLCGGTSVNEEYISGEGMQHYAGSGCQGISIENNRINAATFNNIHFDFYTNDINVIGKVFNIKLVDWAGNLTEEGSTGLEINFNDGTNPNILPGSWISVDVDISSFGPMVIGNLTRSDIAQIHITSNLSNAWYDNLYLYKNEVLNNSENTNSRINFHDRSVFKILNILGQEVTKDDIENSTQILFYLFNDGYVEKKINLM